jgi:hypothetical protein
MRKTNNGLMTIVLICKSQFVVVVVSRSRGAKVS